MLGGVVLLSAVLALLRLSEPRELGADLARVDPGHHARGSAPAVVAAVARGRGAGGGGGCGRGCVARAEDIVDVAAEVQKSLNKGAKKAPLKRKIPHKLPRAYLNFLILSLAH